MPHDFRNATDKRFTDVSNERWREYDFGGRTIRIKRPVLLHAGHDGAHRVFDASGDSHYVRAGWRRMSVRLADRNGPVFGPGQAGFVDVSSEEWRRYDWPDSGTFHVDAPEGLDVLPDGGHCVVAADGTGHHVAPGWVRIQWRARDGQPHYMM